MNFHSRLVGAIDAVVMSSTAVMTILMLIVLLSPPVDRDDMVQGYSVTIEQLPAEA